MKRLLPAAGLALLSLLTLSSPEAQASHAQGGDLRYEYAGTPAQPNRYKVSCRLFRDCSGIPAPVSLHLNARIGTPVTACTSQSPMNFTASLLPQGPPTYGSQYCATVTGVCTASGPTNYEENTYAGFVTLPAGQWTLSVIENARPTLANINGNTNLYFEATLDNRSGLHNSSPSFASSPAVFVGWQQAISVNAGAFDADGDSLAFSLAAPLQDCNTPNQYTTNPLGYPYPGPSGCTAVYSQPMPPLSPTYPLPSVQVSGACPVVTLTPYFLLDAANGQLLFTPMVYSAGSPSQNGNNKYAVVVKVDEYRRVNGAYQPIGSVRRELFVNVYDCGANQMPRFASSMQVYGMTGPVSLNTPIPVRSGAATSLVLTASDANAGQRMQLTANHLNVPGVFAQQTNANTLVMEFTPPSSLPDGTYYITVRAEDDACPIKGFEMKTLAFRVYGSPLSSRGKSRALLSPAFPNPFREQVSFALLRPGQDAAVEVVNQLGQVVDRVPVPAGAPSTETTLTWHPAPQLPAGVYLARFPNGQQTVRLLYQGR